MNRSNPLRALLGPILFLLVMAGSSPAAQFARQVPAKAGMPALQTTAPTGRIIIKFTEESELVVRETGLDGGLQTERARVLGMLANQAGRLPLQRHFSQSFAALAELRRDGQAKTRRLLPNLNAYGILDYSPLGMGREELLGILKNILADPAVETAFLEPRPVPAALGFDAFSGTFTRPEATDRDTPNYQASQGYLQAPPAGINALAVADHPGARGQNMKLVDVELGWNFGHEDLPAPFFTAGNINSTLANRNHGTAVLGEVRGTDNGFGVRGIVPDSQVGASSAMNSSVAGAIMTAWQAVDPGDAVLIELHAPGPVADGNGQFGYVPMEYWQDNFDTIMVITANGAVVCEAAGNGSQNLDDPVYGLLFDRTWRDSGAIMCGAANSLGTPYSWSNNGSRVDLNGWGGGVVTCGYGDLQGSPDFTEDQYYTAYFSGTSSASPIVTGAIMALQGMSKAGYDMTLDALTIRSLLADTGTPQNTGGIVGPRPDILAAFQNLEWGLGEISGTITDAGTGQPIEGVAVSVSDSEVTTVTDADGGYRLILAVGSHVLAFNQFFYQEGLGSRNVEFDNPAVLDLALTRLPAVDIRTQVRTESGAPLTAGRVTPLGVPLTATALPDGDGFLIPAAPIGIPIELLVDNEPFHGVDLVRITPWESVSGFNFVYPELATAEHDFELWWSGYTSLTGEWTWGIPADGPAAFSGERCWGLGMTGDYSAGAIDYLTSDSFNLGGNQETYLSLHYWCDMEDGVDGVVVQILTTNDVWQDIEPLGGYSHDRVTSLGFDSGWSGNSGGWRGAVFDIQEFTELYIRFRFKFTSNNEIEGTGFFVDDVTFDTGDGLSPVEFEPPVPARGRTAVAAHPNPFNPRTTIDWEIRKPGPVTVRVFDTRGHLVRVLMDTESVETRGQVVWDGTDAQGRAQASGTYLVQVRDGSGHGDTRRVTLIK